MNQSDYTKILKFYNIPLPKIKSKRKKMAEDILATKLCRCIKKVSKKTQKKKTKEQDAIRICRNSVLSRKKIKNHSFTCKIKPSFRAKKGSTLKLLRSSDTI
jgi:hypothetical protein